MHRTVTYRTFRFQLRAFKLKTGSPLHSLTHSLTHSNQNENRIKKHALAIHSMAETADSSNKEVTIIETEQKANTEGEK
jgi:hypothetical protein